MRQWFYRGSLKSCNYCCSYCPFSKRPMESTAELERDAKALSRFADRMVEEKDEHFAVQIVPYGEALIHPYYIKELARLSRSPWIDLTGCQSNFSFSVEEMLDLYESHGGIIEKLRLWGSFHPEMVDIETFVCQCSKLIKKGVRFCTGAVGDPERLAVIRQLRKALPPNIYLWINRMDGMGRAYRAEEIQAFLEIDPYFGLELSENAGNKAVCSDSCFVEADGTMRRCNIATGSIGNLYGESEWPGKSGRRNCGQEEKCRDSLSGQNPCRRKRCFCYLAYCNQKLPALSVMGAYPAFRVPQDFMWDG